MYRVKSLMLHLVLFFQKSKRLNDALLATEAVSGNAALVDATISTKESR